MLEKSAGVYVLEIQRARIALDAARERVNWFEEKLPDSREQGMNEWVHSIMKRVQRINFSSEKRDISSLSVIVTDQNISSLLSEIDL